VRGTISKLQTKFTCSAEIYETENGNLVASSDPVRSESVVELLERAAAACADMYKTFADTQNSMRKPSATYIVTVNVNPINGGDVSRSSSKVVYNAGEPLTLTATPYNGYTFTGWSGASTSTNATLTGQINRNLTLTANFQQASTLTVIASPSWGGSVTRSPYKEAYTANEKVTVTAAPASGYTFTGWSGNTTGTTNPVTIVMSSGKALTANFQQAHTLTINVSPQGGGSVTRDSYKEAYTVNEKVTVTATPASGYAFIDWTGAATSKTKHVTIRMNDNKALTANFYLKSILPPTAPKPEADIVQEPPAKKHTLTAVSLDVLGAGILLYGYNRELNVIDKDGAGLYTAAEKSAKQRNVAYTVGSVILLSGISVHIFF